MPSSSSAPRGDRPGDNARAEAVLEALLTAHGWVIHRQHSRAGGPDLVIRRGKVSYGVEVKAAPEGRSDRLIPLWSQALLQVAHAAGDKFGHLAVVVAPNVAPRVAEKVLQFAADYAPSAAVGVMDYSGFSRFRGPHLANLDAEPSDRPGFSSSSRGSAGDSFSDLNQWLLKLLLAPEVLETMLSAPRQRYRNATQLANAGEVSVMTAFRFIEQFREQGFLEDSGGYLTLVRREHLFERWQAAATRRAREASMHFRLRGNVLSQLERALGGEPACLGLFAAANALGFGFVHGVPPHVYVQRIGASRLTVSKLWTPVRPGAMADVILRQATTPRSVFRAMVPTRQGIPASDIVQVWLDVSSHPSRGQEQADLIRRRVLEPIIRAGA